MQLYGNVLRSTPPPGRVRDPYVYANYHWQLLSDIDFSGNAQLHLNLREVGELTVEPVSGYDELNARLSWQPWPALEVALTGRNLLDNDHAEFGDFAARGRIDRSNPAKPSLDIPR